MNPHDSSPVSNSSPPVDGRARGLAAMQQVYGWSVDTVEGAFLETTVDRLFGELWADDVMSIAQRRLLVIGLLVGLGEWDVVDLQLDAAFRLGELDGEQLRHMVTFLAHYAGWPRGAKLNTIVETRLARG